MEALSDGEMNIECENCGSFNKPGNVCRCHKTKTSEFYKNFYDNNRIALLQYNNLRKHFSIMVDNVLGVDYYNMAMDVYESDRICCEDITNKCNK